MSTLALIGILVTILVLSWVVWSLIECARHSIQYEDELDQRLRSINR